MEPGQYWTRLRIFTEARRSHLRRGHAGPLRTCGDPICDLIVLGLVLNIQAERNMATA